MSNPFSHIHTTREGKKLFIASMDAEHLMNNISFHLRRYTEELEDARVMAYGTAAPDNMDPKIARSLKLRKMSDAKKAEIDEKLNLLQDALLERLFDSITPYLVVALARDDVREGAAKLLQDLSGVSGQVSYDIPQTPYPRQPQIEMRTRSYQGERASMDPNAGTIYDGHSGDRDLLADHFSDFLDNEPF